MARDGEAVELATTAETEVLHARTNPKSAREPQRSQRTQRGVLVGDVPLAAAEIDYSIVALMPSAKSGSVFQRTRSGRSMFSRP